MKALAFLFTLTVGILLSGPAPAGETSFLLPGPATHLGLPGPESLYPVLGLDLPLASMISGTAGAIQQPPASAPPKDINLSINVNKGGEARAWYLSPVWMAIGGLGLVLGIILIVMAARGGGSATTVVRS